MGIKAVIFDLDGVIVSTDEYHYQAWKSIADKEKIENEGVKINVRDSYTAAQVGLYVGVGISATPNLGFYGRYNFGLTDVSKFDNIIDQSRVGQIGVTFRINQIK